VLKFSVNVVIEAVTVVIEAVTVVIEAVTMVIEGVTDGGALFNSLINQAASMR
jgi:hypothetical protein